LPHQEIRGSTNATAYFKYLGVKKTVCSIGLKLLLFDGLKLEFYGSAVEVFVKIVL
jgi:hypothetical protein